MYVATMFTYNWRSTVETIRFYSRGATTPIVGGVLASLLAAQLAEATGIIPHVGPLSQQLPRVARAAATSVRSRHSGQNGVECSRQVSSHERPEEAQTFAP